MFLLRMAGVLALSLCALLRAGDDAPKPLFTFGLVADVQYADKPVNGARRYNESADKFARAVDEWQRQGVAFAIEVGDFTDDRGAETKADADRLTAVAKALPVPLYHVLGNHGQASIGRAEYLRRLGVERPYYDFARDGWRFIVVDAFGLSTVGWPADSAELKRGQAYLDAHRGKDRPEVVGYGGGLDEAQVAWLKTTLAKAAEANEKVLLLSHLPLAPESCARGCWLWNSREVLELVESSPAVVAWLAGHDHRGGYVFRKGIHHVTLKGMVESPAGGNAFAVVEVFADRFVLRGYGTMPARTCPARAATPAPEIKAQPKR